jgi:hypothetical protein
MKQVEPPQNIFAAVAAMLAGTEIEMYDETIGMKTNFKFLIDLCRKNKLQK